jgi:hypothetical protein
MGAGRARAQLYDVCTVGITGFPNQAFGYATAILGDLDGDGRSDILVGDPHAGAFPSTWGSGKLVIHSGATGVPIRTLDGAPGSQLGYSVAKIGDLTGDGIPEYAAGAPGTSPGGRVYVYSGATGGVLFTMNGLAQNGASPQGGYQTLSDRLGEAVAGPGDLDLDGVPDIVAGAPQALRCSNGSPFCFLLRPGRAMFYSGLTGSLLLERAGTLAFGQYGRLIEPAGDVNGDGVADVLVGGLYVEVIAGGIGTPIFTIPPTGPGGSLPTIASLASLGDVDGDGRGEFAIGEPNATFGGQTNAGVVTVRSGASGAVMLTIGGPSATAYSGQRMSKIGDVDGDAYPEIAVTGLFFPPPPLSPHRVVRLYSPPTGAILTTWSNAAGPASFGESIAGPADFDGDAIPDLAVGAASISFTNPTGGGVQTFSALTTSPLVTILATPDPFGGNVTDAVVGGDFDGDGVSDIVWITFPARIGVASGATGAQLASADIYALCSPYYNGFRLAAIGDVNGDQVPDVVVSMPSGSGQGGIRAILLSGATFQPIYSIMHTGCSGQFPPVVAIGDQDADGVVDFAIAAPCSAVATSGVVYVNSGATGAPLNTLLNVGTGSANFITLANAGDQDGDGRDDVLIGNPYAPTGQVIAPGEVRVFSATTGALLRSIPGSGAAPAFGYSVSSMPDIDGDGVRDLVASSREGATIGPGAVHVFSGATGAVLHSIPGPGGPTWFGASVAGLGDFEGDGTPDFAVSAVTELTPGHQGVVRVYSGATGAVIGFEPGELFTSNFGQLLRPAGDLNGDGIADVVVIAPVAGSTPRIRVLSFAGVPAGSTAIGSGCPDPAGRVPGLGAIGGLPDVTNGNPWFGLMVSNLAPGATPTVIFGYSTTSWNGFPLPLDLAQFGLAGCTLHCSLDVLNPLMANLAQPAAAVLPLAVPVIPGLAGASIAVQAYVPTTPPAAFPVALTRALQLVAR